MKKLPFLLAAIILIAFGCTPESEPVPVKVASVSIAPTTLEIMIDEPRQLTSTILPSQADDKSVSWTSSAPAVASVSTSGEVTGLSVGAAIITVKTTDGGKTATCSVKVISEPNSDPNNILTLIPDPLFRQYCIDAAARGVLLMAGGNGVGDIYSDPWDNNGDGKLSPAEAAAVTRIGCSNNFDHTGPRIASMEGLEYFTGLRELYCFQNAITSLDISKNTALESIWCDDNPISSLDLSKNTALLNLSCQYTLLTELDVSMLPNLYSLSCGSSLLSQLNVSKNTRLINLNCSESQIVSLDVSKNTALVDLLCGDNQLTELDVSNNPELFQLYCNDNQLTSLDLSANPKIYGLLCRGNRLTSLTLPENDTLLELWCNDNMLSSLDVSESSALTILHCENNPGDGVSKFPVSIWFDNNSIPSGSAPSGYAYDFPRGSWNYDGKTITIDYILIGTPPSDTGYYSSTDYSANGVVTQLQTATQGNGIDLVLMGDGYSDRLVADGTYGRAMDFAMDNFFTEEPYKSHREMFNVWLVTVVSRNEIFAAGSTTAWGCTMDATTSLIEGNHTACINYALKAIPEHRMDNAVIIVMANDTSWHGTCYMYLPSATNDYSGGLSISYFSTGQNEYDFRQLLHHEVNGHGFSKLGDEYWHEDSGTITPKELAEYRQISSSYGWWKNVDVTSDRTQVKWAKFLTDSRYASQRLGVYEGGYVYAHGVWRPSEYSIMRFNTGGFNAPSREAIYYRIHKLAYGPGWTYDYETFVAWDMARRPVSAPYSSQAAGTGVLKPAGHTSPVVLSRPWREMLD